MNIIAALKKIAVVLIVLFVLMMGMIAIPIMVMHHRADQMQKKIVPGMDWKDAAPILDSDRTWWFLTFSSKTRERCARIFLNDKKYIFDVYIGPEAKSLKSKSFSETIDLVSGPSAWKEVQIQSLTDAPVVKQVSSCPNLNVLYQSSTAPERTEFDVILSTN